MKRLIVSVLLSLMMAIPASGMTTVWEKSSGKILAMVKDSRKVELYMRTQIIPNWYGESDKVAVIDNAMKLDSLFLAGLPDSVVWYDYNYELTKIGLVEILSDSVARKIIRDSAPALKISKGKVDSVRLSNEIILIAPGDNLQW